MRISKASHFQSWGKKDKSQRHKKKGKSLREKRGGERFKRVIQ